MPRSLDEWIKEMEDKYAHGTVELSQAEFMNHVADDFAKAVATVKCMKAALEFYGFDKKYEIEADQGKRAREALKDE